MIGKIKGLFGKRQEVEVIVKQEIEKEMEKKQEITVVKPTEYRAYHTNGILREKCPLNFNGDLHGWMIIYNEEGNEVEKIEYKNGISFGNPFQSKSFEETAEMLGLDPEEDGEFLGEPDNEVELTPELASTMLKGEKYYGKEPEKEKISEKSPGAKKNKLLEYYNCETFEELEAKVQMRDESVMELVKLLEIEKGKEPKKENEIGI